MKRNYAQGKPQAAFSVAAPVIPLAGACGIR